MLVEQVIIQPKKASFIVPCELCHNDAKGKPVIKRLGPKLGIICNTCREQFSDQEIDLMINMFIAFGGYFNQFKSSRKIQQTIINEIAREHDQKEQGRDKVENDVRVLHRAFLHGISLPQLVHTIPTQLK
jgi:hypothetical protein